MASVQMDGSANFTLNLTITESSTNPTTNTSVISYDLYINPPGGIESYNLTSSNQTYYVKFYINGVWTTIASGNFTYDFRSPNDNVNKHIKTSTYTLTHDADGTYTASDNLTKGVLSATAQATTTNANIGDGTIASFNTAITDFSRVPAAPAAPTVALNASNPMAVDITSAESPALSPVGSALTDYEYQVSTDNSTWGSAVSMGLDRAATFTSTNPGLYYFQTRAVSSEGAGAWSPSSSVTTFSGGKVWNGTAFVPGQVKVWNGTAFVNGTVKVWNGSAFVNAK